jgi:hypothetical protein
MQNYLIGSVNIETWEGSIRKGAYVGSDTDTKNTFFSCFEQEKAVWKIFYEKLEAISLLESEEFNFSDYDPINIDSLPIQSNESQLRKKSEEKLAWEMCIKSLRSEHHTSYLVCNLNNSFYYLFIFLYFVFCSNIGVIIE